MSIVPHTIPEWDLPPRPGGHPFTIGFAGRLIEQKGIRDLLDAVALLPFPFRLLIAGQGPLREVVEAADLGQGTLELMPPGLRPDDLPATYAEMDVLVLPSRTTETWAEQFGKVLAEALLCGTPVVGASSGAIPWVIETTGGGRVFPEGDAAALAALLAELHDDPAQRARLAQTGRQGVVDHLVPRVAAAELDRLMRGAIAAGPAAAGRRHPWPVLAPRR
jgi:glycosyltransferase involved in cell wall biosynthesis